MAMELQAQMPMSMMMNAYSGMPMANIVKKLHFKPQVPQPSNNLINENLSTYKLLTSKIDIL
jgi:hypothetical protein